MLFAIETSCGHKHADFRQGFPLAVSANSAVQTITTHFSSALMRP